MKLFISLVGLRGFKFACRIDSDADDNLIYKTIVDFFEDHEIILLITRPSNEKSSMLLMYYRKMNVMNLLMWVTYTGTLIIIEHVHYQLYQKKERRNFVSQSISVLSILNPKRMSFQRSMKIQCLLN